MTPTCGRLRGRDKRDGYLHKHCCGKCKHGRGHGVACEVRHAISTRESSRQSPQDTHDGPSLVNQQYRRGLVESVFSCAEIRFPGYPDLVGLLKIEDSMMKVKEGDEFTGLIVSCIYGEPARLVLLKHGPAMV